MFDFDLGQRPGTGGTEEAIEKKLVN